MYEFLRSQELNRIIANQLIIKKLKAKKVQRERKIAKKLWLNNRITEPSEATKLKNIKDKRCRSLIIKNRTKPNINCHII